MEFSKITTPNELYSYMRQHIKYGFISLKDLKPYVREQMNDDRLYEKLLFHTYYLQKPDEILKSGYGICYDQVELERYWFLKHGYQVWTYYTPYHNHAFLIYKDGPHYILYERSIKKYNGIYPLNSLEEALAYYKKMQLQDSCLSDISFYCYDEVPFGCSVYEFIDFVTKDKTIAQKLREENEKLDYF